MLDNLELTCICKDLEIPLNGIYMKNELPKKLKNGNYIVNLDSAPNFGTHWLTLILRDKDALFCDPFGAPPPVEVEEALKKIKNIYIIQPG